MRTYVLYARMSAFVNEFFPDRPDLLVTAQRTFSGIPLAHLFFCKDESYWDAVEKSGL